MHDVEAMPEVKPAPTFTPPPRDWVREMLLRKRQEEAETARRARDADRPESCGR